VRRDAPSVGLIAAALGDGDKAVACAAACALGNIGNMEAGKALYQAAKTAPEGVKAAVADGCLACAERLLAEGNKAGATALYKVLNTPDQPKHVRLAATRGLLAVAGKKQ
jgi:HEAT repeat protein